MAPNRQSGSFKTCRSHLARVDPCRGDRLKNSSRNNEHGKTKSWRHGLQTEFCGRLRRGRGKGDVLGSKAGRGTGPASGRALQLRHRVFSVFSKQNPESSGPSPSFLPIVLALPPKGAQKASTMHRLSLLPRSEPMVSLPHQPIGLPTAGSSPPGSLVPSPHISPARATVVSSHHWTS